MGIDMSSEQRAAVALAIADLTPDELATCVRELVNSPDFADALRYRSTLTPAEFRRVLAHGKHLLTYAEALAAWNKVGSIGTFPDAMFEIVASNGDRFYKPKRR